MKRILIGFDGSHSSESALQAALKLAVRHQAKLLGVIVEDERRLCDTPFLVGLAAATGLTPQTKTPLPPDEMLDAIEQVERDSQKLADAFSERTQDAGVHADLIIERGDVSEQLAEHAKSVDFICLGRFGSHTGVRHIKEGSTLNAVSREVSTPILAAVSPQSSFETVMLAFDGGDASFRALKLLPEVIEPSPNSKVVVVTVGGSTEEAQMLQLPAQEFLNQSSIPVEVKQSAGDPGEQVLAAAEECSADLIALGAYGSGALLELLCGSTTKTIMRGADSALLLVP